MRTQGTTRRRRLGVRAVVVPIVCALVAAGAACSQPRLERLARELARAVPRTPDTTVTGTIGIRFVDVQVKGADSQAAQFRVADAAFVAQPGTGRFALEGPAGRIALADHRVLYARRTLNGPADHRPWVRLEVERLEEVEVPRLQALVDAQDSGVLAVITPRLVLDSLHGVLTGSVKQRRLSDGRRAFRFNVSLDKAARELDLTEDERDDLELLQRSIALTGDIFAASATLRPDGSLADMTLHLVEHPDKRSRVKLDVTLKVEPPVTTAASLRPPKRENTIRVSSLAAVRGSIVEQLGGKRPLEPGSIAITLRDGQR